MADVSKMDRTWLCSVVFMDIVNYSSQSVELQMKWKQRFNGYLAEAIHEVPESERVILDTGDGAAVCFLGAPEAAMFAALQLCRSFVVDEREQKPGLLVRIGINLGPVKLIKDINGALNAIGDGINAGQRIMSFAAANQILVSQSFFEVVSRLSDDYKKLFELKGVEKDKHVREHTVYHLVQPGSEKREPAVTTADSRAMPSTPDAAVAAAPGMHRRDPRSRSTVWASAGVAVVVLAALGAWRFYGSGAVPKTSSLNAAPVAQDQTSTPAPTPAATAPEPSPPAQAGARPDKSTSAAHRIETPEAKTAQAEKIPRAAPAPASNDAKAAYDDAIVLLDQHKPVKAAKRFDDALRASPDYVEAYVGRAQARRGLEQYQLSLEDCNQIIRINPNDPRGYNCRGYGYELLKHDQPAIRDFDKAISLNPNFAQAYADRGAAYGDLDQYDRALKDLNEAIRLRPGIAVFHLRRAAVYQGLKQYAKAIQDDTEAIRLQPDDLKAYAARASAEETSGDAAAAASDRRHVQEMRKKKSARE
jgi:tetratricopeptide (TPR) repeat protein/class 3 adenylate cyclase